MTDQERIKDLERRVEQLEDLFRRLTGSEGCLWVHTPCGSKVMLRSYIECDCQFGKAEEDKQ